MQRKVAVWGLAAVLALVAVGCGQTKDSTGTVDAGGVEAPTAAFLSGAAGKTAEATTGKIALTMSITGMGSGKAPITVTATGAYDNAARQAQLSVDLASLTGSLGALGGSSAGLNQPLEEVVSDGHLYMKLGAMGSVFGAKTPWVEIKGLDALSKQLTGSSGLSLDPNDTKGMGTDYLSYLQGIAGTVTEVGTETVDGVDTTHYKADIDIQDLLAKAGDQLSPAAKKRLQDMTAKATGSIPVEVWIGSDGLVRRVTMTMDASSMGMGSTLGAKGGSATGSVGLTLDLTEVGQPVQITVPPADQVSTLDLGAKMQGMMSKLGGLSAGSGN